MFYSDIATATSILDALNGHGLLDTDPDRQAEILDVIATVLAGTDE